jgi:hypothetical protein
MSDFGGGMTCVLEIRFDGRGPVPVADTRKQAHKSGPKTCRPHQILAPAQRGPIGLNTPGCGAAPHGVRAQRARSLLSLPTTE